MKNYQTNAGYRKHVCWKNSDQTRVKENFDKKEKIQIPIPDHRL